MCLNKYLEVLENCPDEYLEEDDKWRLEKELYICDNWPVLLSANYDEVVKDLIGSVDSDMFFSGQYKQTRICPGDNGEMNKIFEYVSGIVTIQVQNSVAGYYCTHDRPELIHFNRQQRDFNVVFCLHPYQEKIIEGMSSSKAIATVVADISRYAQTKGVALCIPNSGGLYGEIDSSKIVYFDPSELPTSSKK